MRRIISLAIVVCFAGGNSALAQTVAVADCEQALAACDAETPRASGTDAGATDFTPFDDIKKMTGTTGLLETVGAAALLKELGTGSTSIFDPGN